MKVTGAPIGEGRPSPVGDTGTSLSELLVVLAIVAIVSAWALPRGASAMDEVRVRQAAGYLAGRVRLARQQAVLRTTSVGLVFDAVNGRWAFRLCLDGNGNGIRRAELGSTDRCTEGPVDVVDMFPGVSVAVDATIRGPDGEAPSTDPVRLGSSNLASFSPAGTCTSGSIFLRSTNGEQFAVRIAGATGRTRVLRYDRVTRTWRDL